MLKLFVISKIQCFMHNVNQNHSISTIKYNKTG